MSDFSPAWFLRGPHAQTIWGRIARPRRLVTMRRESLETPDGDELVLDHLDDSDGRGQMADGPTTPPSAIRHPPSDRLHFLLLHGLEGSSYSVYIQGVLAEVQRLGHAATVMNFRSCARDPGNILRMLPNRRPRFYHSGETGDFDFLIRTLAARLPEARFVAFGASLGGNVLLKWLGEHPGQQLVRAVATLSVPYDLAAGSRYLEETTSGPFYVSGFLRTLKKKTMRADIAPLLDLPRVLRSRTFREFDEYATGPLHGFTGADDYYERSSSIHYLGRITTPALALSAEDDPFLPPDTLPRARAAASPAVELRVTSGGGHVGFIGGRAPWRCEYWAEVLAVRWLIDQVNGAAR